MRQRVVKTQVYATGPWFCVFSGKTVTFTTWQTECAQFDSFVLNIQIVLYSVHAAICIDLVACDIN